MVESSSSPQLTTISPGKNIVETQCLQEFYLTGFKADDDSLNTRSEILEVKSQLSVAFRNESNDSVSSIDSHSVTYTTEESMETPSSENGQTLDSVGEPSPQKSTEMAKHELKESSVNKDEVSNSLLSNLADVEKKEELVVEVQIPGQDSVHIGSNEGESLGTAIEVQVLERTPDILMSDDRTESSVEELLRDLKLDDSKNTTPSITDGDSEPSGGARKKIFPLVQQVANSSEETSVSVRTEHSSCSVYSYFINGSHFSFFQRFLSSPFSLSFFIISHSSSVFLTFCLTLFSPLSLPSFLWLSSHSPLFLTPRTHIFPHSLLSLSLLHSLTPHTHAFPHSPLFLTPHTHAFPHSLLCLTPPLSHSSHSCLSSFTPLSFLTSLTLPPIMPFLIHFPLSLLPSLSPSALLLLHLLPSSLLHSHFLSLFVLCFCSLKILTWRRIYSLKLLVNAQPHVIS